MGWLLGVLLLAMAFPASAHKSSDSYLQLDATSRSLAVRWDIALRDLDAALDLDTDADGKLSWREVRDAYPRIDAYALPRLAIAGCELTLARHTLEQRNDGAYAVLWLESPCELAGPPVVTYRLFTEIDPTHRGIARIAREGGALQLRVLDPRSAVAVGAVAEAQPASAGGAPSSTAPSSAGGAAGATPASSSVSPSDRGSFLREGITHILGGYDHVLFLVVLLLPAVLRRDGRAADGTKKRGAVTGGGIDVAARDVGPRPVDRLWQAVWPVAGIVTAFTVAHSITLALAALKLVSLSPSLIEPAIALTIMAAALDNVNNIFRGHRAWVTFAFGLVHGFGFAGVLGELDLPVADFALALFEFNIGLELGQLAIVVVVVGLLYSLRRASGYRKWVVGGGSLVAGLVALVWFVERVSGSKWLPW